MDYRTYEQRIHYLLELISKGRVRTKKDAAVRFNCSETTIKRMLRHLKENGHVIYFSYADHRLKLKKDED